MDAIVMAGGEGTRLESDTEKPLFEIYGEPLIVRVIDALKGSSVDRIFVSVSPHTPDTREYVGNIDGVEIIETSGDGYVEDLNECLEKVGIESEVVSVVSDLGLLDSETVDGIIERHDQGSVTVYVTEEFCKDVGIDPDTVFDGLVPTGINIVDPRDEDGSKLVIDDIRLAVNVNRVEDAERAEKYLREASEEVGDEK